MNEFQDFGYPTTKPCDVCGKAGNNQMEPRFGYVVCEEHFRMSPVAVSVKKLMVQKASIQKGNPMQITFIGCGDSFSEQLGNNSALVEFNDSNLLIDIPDSNYCRIRNINKDYSDIHNIFITHLHGDHINGLERFAYYRKYAMPIVRPNTPNTKPQLFIHQNLYQGLWESAKNGLGVTIDGVKTLEDYFEVKLVRDSFVIDGVTFMIKPVLHVPLMNAYGLYVPGRFFYTGDSTFNDKHILKHLSNGEAVFHDTHFFDSEIKVHASIRDFSSIPVELKKNLYAMHYDDSIADAGNIDGVTLVKPYKSFIL